MFDRVLSSCCEPFLAELELKLELELGSRRFALAEYIRFVLVLLGEG
jgi:hypothetical protein